MYHFKTLKATGMPGKFFPPPTLKEAASLQSRYAARHVRHARAVMHVGIANLWWWGKRSRHSRPMRTRNFTYLVRGQWQTWFGLSRVSIPGKTGCEIPAPLRNINSTVGKSVAAQFGTGYLLWLAPGGFIAMLHATADRYYACYLLEIILIMPSTCVIYLFIYCFEFWIF